MENITLNEYQSQTRGTAIYPTQAKANFPLYPILGLVGEAGEVAEKAKKIIRDHNGLATSSDLHEMAKELGDVLWYVSQIAYDIGYDLESIARMNLDKLNSRKDRGQLGGSGDGR